MTEATQFMEDIFERTDFLFYLFNEAVPFNGSGYEAQVQTQYELSEEEFLSFPKKYQESIFLSKHTNWLIADKDGKVYGEYQGHILVGDQEGLVDYYCENFYDIPFVMWNYKEENWKKAFQKHWLLEKNIDVYQKFAEYQKFCESYGFTLPNALRKYKFQELLESVELAI